MKTYHTVKTPTKVPKEIHPAVSITSRRETQEWHRASGRFRPPNRAPSTPQTQKSQTDPGDLRMRLREQRERPRQGERCAWSVTYSGFGRGERKKGRMNFTADMLAKLHPQERLLLQMLYDRTVEQRPTQLPEWPWTMKGPATEAQAFRARRGVPSPRLTAGTSASEVPSLEEPASSGDRGSQDASPAQHQSTRTE